MSGTIWVVSSGSYSDYRVHAVFADELAAKRAVGMERKPYGESYVVETLPFFATGEFAEMVTEYRHNIVLWDDGRSDQEHVSEETGPEFDLTYGPPPARPQVRYVRAPIYGNKGGRIEVRGADRAAVDKTLTDKVAEWRANPTIFARSRQGVLAVRGGFANPDA